MQLFSFIRKLIDRARKIRMSSTPPISEQDFLRLSKNHRELSGTLDKLGHSPTSQHILKEAERVALCWFRLGQEHLKEAKLAHAHSMVRASYSRAYYAAYNVSKSVRYFYAGWVSLKGDDHGKAGDLPDNFPNVSIWSSKISRLYEHRLRADYDNWNDTRTLFALSTEDCCDIAEDFIDIATVYLQSTFGIKP